MAEQPNVLLLTADHWPASLLDCSWHPAIETDSRQPCEKRNSLYQCLHRVSCLHPARRTLLTGTTPKSHGDRTFQVEMKMPDIPTIADVFSQQGYQTYASGKLPSILLVPVLVS